MRRALLLLLAVLIPLKIAAAAIVPIVGMPAMIVEKNSAHLHHASAAADDQGMAGEDACCPDHDGSGSDRLHDHSCPHLAMAGLTGVQPELRLPHYSPLPPAEPAQHFASVVLDVLLPPPTGLA